MESGATLMGCQTCLIFQPLILSVCRRESFYFVESCCCLGFLFWAVTAILAANGQLRAHVEVLHVEAHVEGGRGPCWTEGMDDHSAPFPPMKDEACLVSKNL